MQLGRHRLVRLHAALTALAFVLSSLGGLVHETAIQHVRCEHGELIHADAGTGLAQVRDAGRDAIVHGIPGAPVAEHEHCAVSHAMRASRVVPRPPTIAPVRIAIDNVVTLASTRVVARGGGALYRTAPKTSPPV